MEPLRRSDDDRSIGNIPIFETFENTTHPSNRKPDPLTCEHVNMIMHDGKEMCMSCMTTWSPRPSWSNRGDGYPTAFERGRIEFRRMAEGRQADPEPLTMQSIIQAQEQAAWEYMMAPPPLTWGTLGMRVMKFFIISSMLVVCLTLVLSG